MTDYCLTITKENSMINFQRFVFEEYVAEDKNKHIEHVEDNVLNADAPAGFKSAIGSLTNIHHQLVNGTSSGNLTMKYDGSPAIVYGHHPETGKFFVGIKSALSKNPKLNYTHEDIQKNYSKAPGLVEKMSAALDHLPKITPSHGVYQGDLMFTKPDVKTTKKGVSFTPNTITYTAKGDDAEKIKKAKLGIVNHTKYTGSTMETLKAEPFSNPEEFVKHPDVYNINAEHDIGKLNYSDSDISKFNGHISAAQNLHHMQGAAAYNATERDRGDRGNIKTYINHTVRSGDKPSTEGFAKFMTDGYVAKANAVKRDATKSAKLTAARDHITHILHNTEHYDTVFKIHNHLQNAKHVLLGVLNQDHGSFEHTINDNPSKPEGFVHRHEGKTNKYVDRTEFSKSNFEKNRTPAKAEGEKSAVVTFGRFNPPTAGHEKLINKIKGLAKQNSAEPIVIVSHSHDAAYNILPQDVKMKHLNAAFKGVNFIKSDHNAPSLVQHLHAMHDQGYKHVTVVTGADRKDEFEDLADRYFRDKFKSIKVVSAGDRDEESSDVDGISASKMRQAALLGDRKSFHEMAPSTMSTKQKDEMLKDVQSFQMMHN